MTLPMKICLYNIASSIKSSQNVNDAQKDGYNCNRLYTHALTSIRIIV